MLTSCPNGTILLLLFEVLKTDVNCVCVCISISCAGLISDWCILIYQGPLTRAEQNQLLSLVTVKQMHNFYCILKNLAL